MKKAVIFRVFRAAYTIVWACLMLSVILLTLLNHKYFIDDVGYGVLMGIAVIASYVEYLVWDVELIPKEDGNATVQ